MEMLNELITTEFLTGIVLGVVMSSLIPIKIEIGERQEFDSGVKAKAPKGKIDTFPPDGIYFPRGAHRPKGEIRTNPPSPEDTMNSINRKETV